MSRYIDADKVLEKMRKTFDMQDLYLPIHLKELIIDDMPTADVRPNVHGEWLYEQLIPNTIEGKMYGECSVCHKVRIVDNFCPNCGALMSESLKWAEIGKAIAEGLNEGLNCDIVKGEKNENR